MEYLLRKVLLLLMLALVVPAHAAVYRCKDSSGREVYTDTPCLNGEEIKVTPNTPLATPQQLPFSSGTPAAVFQGYTAFSITEPQQDSYIRTNAPVNITFEIKPKLRPNHVIQVYVDGQATEPVKDESTVVNIVLPGPHTVAAHIVDQRNNTLISAPTVSFTVLKQGPAGPQTKPLPGMPGMPKLTGPGPGGVSTGEANNGSGNGDGADGDSGDGSSGDGSSGDGTDGTGNGNDSGSGNNDDTVLPSGVTQFPKAPQAPKAPQLPKAPF